MQKQERCIAVIPARGGSKAVPRKNVRILAGKPLITWTIDLARRISAINRVLVSTDDLGIAAVSRAEEAEVYERPAHLATDESLVIDALRDLILTLRSEGEGADLFVLLEPTCPLRRAEDILACIELVASGGFESAATFTEAELNPHRAWKIVDGVPQVFIEGAVPWLPRQKLPPAYQLNGAVYAFRGRCLDDKTPSLLTGRTAAVRMPRDRSLDINDALDFETAEILMKKWMS